ncbi:MAG: Gfo/Idh/MocA family oxidoreductase, partial [Planctomycetota bacterium]|nr:Gfo/Idh/MocA family oxidoreductase [Planctomycetota bacterium]
MSARQSRREFLKRAAVCAGAVAGAQAIGAPYILAAGATDKLRVAVIGCGGQGTGTHVPAAMGEQLVALVDADEKSIANAFKRTKEVIEKAKDKDAYKGFDAAKVRVFSDYRKLFDEMGKEIDAISVATPNHQHALPALMAMKLGKGAYVEKPMAYNISEARMLAEWSVKYKVATQMGNQGHSGESYRRLCEYIWAGAIRKVTEVHCWSDRANGGVGPRPPTLPVPKGMNWENWIGPGPYRDYHKDLHPHEWHGWHDFGDGSLGNMGCHVLDGAVWALKLGHPTSIEVEEMAGGTEERYPIGTKIRWDFPAREDMPPVKLYWYDGKRKGIRKAGEGDTPDSVARNDANRPALFAELEKKYDRKFETNGTFYIGDKGIMFTGCYGGGVRIIPEEQHKAFPQPGKTLPRPKGAGHHGNFFQACKGGEPACSNFEVASRLTEIVLLGCLAIKAGLGKKVEWDGPTMKCTNVPELNKHLSREYRKG